MLVISRVKTYLVRFLFSYHHFHHRSTTSCFHPPLLFVFSCTPLARGPPTWHTLSAQTVRSERETRVGWGWGQGVRSQEEDDEKKGRLIIKVLQPASPWRTGSEKGFRGLDLSTGDRVPKEGDCGSQSRPPTSPHVPVATAPAALVS